MTGIRPAVGCLLCSTALVLAFCFLEDILELVHGHPDGVTLCVALLLFGALGVLIRRQR